MLKRLFSSGSQQLSSKAWTEIIARQANLVCHCYKKRDISGIQVAITSLTHFACVVAPSDQEALIAQFIQCLKAESFPEAEVQYVQWLLRHFFEIEQSEPAEFMLPWYTQLDDEWLVRQQMRAAAPDMRNTEITAMLLHEAQKPRKV